MTGPFGEARFRRGKNYDNDDARQPIDARAPRRLTPNTTTRALSTPWRPGAANGRAAPGCGPSLRSHAGQPDAAEGLELTLDGRQLRLTARGDDPLGARQARPRGVRRISAAVRASSRRTASSRAWEAPLDLPSGEAVRLSVRQAREELRRHIPMRRSTSSGFGSSRSSRLPVDQDGLGC